MALVLHLLRPEDGFADIGANIGSYSVLASAVVGARTTAFEPHPATHAKLLRNVAVNGIGEKVDAVLSAVGREAGVLRFTADRDTMNQVVGRDYRGAVIDVPVVCLDDRLRDFPALLWKIDVEGFEEEVLEGAGRALADPRLKALMVETESARTVEILRKQGFEACSYDPFRREFREGKGGSHNALWIRDRQECEARVQSSPMVEVLGVSF